MKAKKTLDEFHFIIKKQQTELENTFKINVLKTFESRGIVVSRFALENGWETSYFNKMIKTNRVIGLTFANMVKISFCLDVDIRDLLKDDYSP